MGIVVDDHLAFLALVRPRWLLLSLGLRLRLEFDHERAQIMNQELCQDLVVGSLILNQLKPHVHDDHVLVIFDEFLRYLEELGEEFKALVIYQIVE